MAFKWQDVVYKINIAEMGILKWMCGWHMVSQEIRVDVALIEHTLREWQCSWLGHVFYILRGDASPVEFVKMSRGPKLAWHFVVAKELAVLNFQLSSNGLNRVAKHWIIG